jgi:hypothetical protein
MKNLDNLSSLSKALPQFWGFWAFPRTKYQLLGLGMGFSQSQNPTLARIFPCLDAYDKICFSSNHAKREKTT